MLPIRKWRESLRDLRRLEVEGAILVVLVLWRWRRRCDDAMMGQVRCWHVNVNVETERGRGVRVGGCFVGRSCLPHVQMQIHMYMNM